MIPCHAARLDCSETGYIPLLHARRSPGQDTSNYQHNPVEAAPSRDVSALQTPWQPRAAPQVSQGNPAGTEGTYSRDSAWLFWKRSSGRVCSWLRFSRLQGRRKG